MSRELTITSGRQIGFDMIGAGIGAGLVALCGAALLAGGSRARGRPAASSLSRGSIVPRRRSESIVTAAQRLNRAAGLLAFSVLADSAVEHYRGAFSNRVMYAPLAVSALALGASAHGTADRRVGAHRFRDASYCTALGAATIGTAFHLYNVGKRVGGLRWENLFYGAPLGAPSALFLSGIIGFMAERVRNVRPGARACFLGLPVGRFTAALTAAGLLGTAGEAGLLHFRGAYHNPFMFIPVTIPPAAALVMSEVALSSESRRRVFSRWWLRLTTGIGFAGVAFHTYGVHRNMGGWRNWRQNLLNGPPIPAPPSFTALALAGLAALSLREEMPDA